MDRKMDAVSSLDEAQNQVKKLRQIDEQYLDEETSARWSIEYCERYQSLQNGLEELHSDGVLDEDPDDVLVEIGRTNYSEAYGMLEEEENDDAPRMDSTVHRQGSPGRGGRF